MRYRYYKGSENKSDLCSFVPSGVARLLAVMRHASSRRQCCGLGLAQCTSPLTQELVLYILRAQLS